jgi:hypothetical protein
LVQAITRERTAAIRGRAQAPIEVAEPALVFSAPVGHVAVLELLVNFGPFAGREATPAEIDELGRELLTKVGRVTVVSERRYEIGHEAEGVVHQVRIEIGPEALPRGDCDLAELRGRLIEATERWARACIHARHQELDEA